MEQRNEYVFHVIESATKTEVLNAIEQAFNTKVKSVHVLNVKSKQKLFRGVKGKRKGWKKAYVTLQADQKIDLIGAQ
jgi:large subunit ribosomal protein L23